jgi:osmotically-inducible protein OsmY
MSDDIALRDAVLAELDWEPTVAADHIGVTAEAGVVTLSGHVDTYAEKHAAEAAATRVKGVRAVAEELKVRLPFEHERSDTEIAEAVLNRLAWNSRIPGDRVTVKVQQGWVTLGGDVAAHYQRQAAEDEVRPLMGVLGVSNDIAIKPDIKRTVDVQDLSDDITHALHRSWFFDPKLIRVTADGGTILLTGCVHFARDRQIAAATAWAAPGVTDVRNEITVA